MDETQTQLEWEARAGRLAAVAAFLSAACVIGGLIARASIGKGSSKKAESLRIAHNHSGDVIAFAVLTAISIGLLVFVLLYLYRAAKFRRPELPTVAAYTAVGGPALLMVSGIVGTLQLIDKANQFVASGPQTEARAKHLTDNSVSPVIGGLGLAGAVATGVALMMIAINAMRGGLLSRFMGILGVIYGALQVLPILPGPVIQVFWTCALGALFLGYWPNGRGPAWETGEAIEWPTQAQRLGERDKAEEPDDEIEEPEEPEQPVTQRNPNARSRKRKKRKAGR